MPIYILTTTRANNQPTIHEWAESSLLRGSANGEIVSYLPTETTDGVPLLLNQDNEPRQPWLAAIQSNYPLFLNADGKVHKVPVYSYYSGLHRSGYTHAVMPHFGNILQVSNNEIISGEILNSPYFSWTYMVMPNPSLTINGTTFNYPQQWTGTVESVQGDGMLIPLLTGPTN